MFYCTLLSHNQLTANTMHPLKKMAGIKYDTGCLKWNFLQLKYQRFFQFLRVLPCLQGVPLESYQFQLLKRYNQTVPLYLHKLSRMPAKAYAHFLFQLNHHKYVQYFLFLRHRFASSQYPFIYLSNFRMIFQFSFNSKQAHGGLLNGNPP